MTLICGIDEAGRGPVIGPLVIAGVLVEQDSGLKSIGVKDSKLLTKRKRESLFQKIIDTVKDYKIIKVSPSEIDSALTSEELNLNWLEALKAAEIINKLKPDKVIIDSPSNNTEAFSTYVKKLLINKTELNCLHKADLKYVEVGAASILAKVTRDNEIEKIKKQIKVEFGSGYPSDPVTIDFLKNNFQKYPEIFRKTWASYKKVQIMRNQKKIDDFQKNL